MDELPRFVVDAMLGSLARKLRIIGFDVLYFRDGPDHELEEIARSEDRMIITADLALSCHASGGGTRSFLVRGKTDARRLREVVEQAEASSVELRPGPSRCASCNVVLETLRETDLLPDSRPKTSRRHRSYFQCPACGQLFWKGSHWPGLRRMAALFPHE